MQTYIDEKKKECVVTLTDLKVVEGYYTKVIDLKPLKNVLKALETLGKNIEGMYLEHTILADIDTKYYRRFPEELIDKLWERFDKWHLERKVILKNNRLYIIEDGIEIVCPRDMHDMYSYDNKTLTVTIKWN